MKLIRTKEWLLRFAVASTLIIALLFIVGAILSSKCSAIIEKQIKTNLEPTIKVDFASCELSLISRSIIFNDVRGSYQPDSLSANKHLFASHKIEFRKIDVLQFLVSRKIRVDETIITNADLAVNKFLLVNADSLNGTVKKNENLSSIDIDHLVIKNCRLSLMNDSTTEFSSIVNIAVKDIHVPKKTDNKLFPIPATLKDSSIKEIFFSPDDSHYSIKIKKVTYDELKKSLFADSVTLEPKYGKAKFARLSGKEIDRFELSIPSLRINNINSYQFRDSVYNATGIHLYSPQLKVYRDKRLPFIKPNDVDLPIVQLRQLPFKLSLDTIQIHEGTVSYEEFPAGGDSSGLIVFHALKASAYNIKNYDSLSNHHFDLDVETRFMNSGLLKVSFDFPFNGNQRNSAKGSLSNFDLTALNSIMKPLAKMSIESGQMESLTFDFSYDKFYATGEVELNYRDLKILSLTEKQSKTVVDKLKTFLLNAFIPRKKDETTSGEKRKGQINFARDPKRSIFNYWWKSLFSGVKSSYGLEKGSEVK